MVELTEFRPKFLDVGGSSSLARNELWYILPPLFERALSHLGIKGSNLLTDPLMVSLVVIFEYH